MKWQYKTITANKQETLPQKINVDTALKIAGDDDWELVSSDLIPGESDQIHNYAFHLIFKKPSE